MPVGPVPPVDLRAAADPQRVRGQIGAFVTSFGTRLSGLPQNFYHVFKETTQAFAHLFRCSAAIIGHGARYQYFIMEADFSHGQFMKKDYMGVEDIGWDRFDKFFPTAIEDGYGIYVPNINGSAVIVFNQEGEVVWRGAEPEAIAELLIDRSKNRDFMSKGSFMLIPVVVGGREQGRRALAYLYSPEVDHFDLPIAGYAGFLLAGAAKPFAKQLLGS